MDVPLVRGALLRPKQARARLPQMRCRSARGRELRGRLSQDDKKAASKKKMRKATRMPRLEDDDAISDGDGLDEIDPSDLVIEEILDGVMRSFSWGDSPDSDRVVKSRRHLEKLGP